jgi:hypothetical protein
MTYLAGELTAKRDARAEDELRALVGEYDTSAWQAKAAEHDAGIQILESERLEHEAEHARVRDLLAESTRASRGIAAGPTPAPSVESVDAKAVVESRAADDGAPAPRVASPTPGTGATQSPDQASARGAKRPSPFDEIGFMRSVVGRATPFAGIEIPSEDGQRATPDRPSETASQDGRMTTPSQSAASSTASRETNDRRAEPRNTGSFEAPPIPDAPAAAPSRATAPVPSGNDDATAGATDTPSRQATAIPDAARSLKCQECGWMNYPTEWYCEKCGGELAAF